MSFIFKVELLAGSLISVSTMSSISRSDTNREKWICCFGSLLAFSMSRFAWLKHRRWYFMSSATAVRRSDEPTTLLNLTFRSSLFVCWPMALSWAPIFSVATSCNLSALSSWQMTHISLSNVWLLVDRCDVEVLSDAASDFGGRPFVFCFTPLALPVACPFSYLILARSMHVLCVRSL